MKGSQHDHHQASSPLSEATVPDEQARSAIVCQLGFRPDS